jgi:hypothetical protein
MHEAPVRGHPFVEISLADATEASLGQLAEHSGAPLANVPQHLNRLAGGGIVGRPRQVTSIIYWMSDPNVSELCDLQCLRLTSEASARKARSA